MLDQRRIDAMRTAGWWRDQLLLEAFDRHVARNPEKIALVALDTGSGRRVRFSYGELAWKVDRIALNLTRLGLRRGDVLSCQLPPWWQFAALHLACLRIGVITNALMPILRERELSFMLELAESKLLVIPKHFRGHDYASMVAGIRDRLPQLRHVLEIDASDSGSFDAELLDFPAPETWREYFQAPGANDVIQLLYTSGTTGEPKGVMHTSNTLMSGLDAYARRTALSADDTFLVATPIAHQTGFVYGVVVGLYVGGKVVMQDAWDPLIAADLIESEQVSVTNGATPFLADLTELAASRPTAFASLRLFFCGGAAIPRALVRRGIEQMQVHLLTAWGMTENGPVTTTTLDDPPEKIFETDGKPLDGLEVRVVDAHGACLPSGEEGFLQARGCSQFVGYLKRPDQYATDAQGWLDTGDLARMDADGYIRVTGRSKDIVIRGGENIPVVEVEGLLYRHPKVAEVAIVGMPDERLGERCCAFVVARPGEALDLAEICAFLVREQLARQYLPERLELVASIPKTPSGKVQKSKLREMAKQFRKEPV
ncbi:MAG: AMP-binding protein [Janthinobacterium lividum]